MTIDVVAHTVTERPVFATEEKTRAWSSDEWAAFLNGWSFQTLGYPNRDEANPFFVAGVGAAKKARAS